MTTRFPLALALALVASLTAGQPSDVDERITSGKLQADLGDWKGAAAAFDAAARDPQATAAQQWEALVRLGVARRALGDARGSVEAFEQVMAEHADDSDAVRFLALSLGGALPGRERWDAIWRDVKLAVDGRGSARPSARIAWPGVGVVEPRGGERMSLDFVDGNLGDIFRLFADFTGLNVVVQPGVRGQITLHAKDEPWQDVLQKVLAPNGYRYSLEGKRALDRAGRLRRALRAAHLEGQGRGRGLPQRRPARRARRSSRATAVSSCSSTRASRGT